MARSTRTQRARPVRHAAPHESVAGIPGRAASFARRRVTRLADGGWAVSRQRFQDVAFGTRSSALASERLSYLVSLAACCADLCACYSDWISKATSPADFNYAFLASAPKVLTDDLAPHEMRPPLLASTDYRIMAAMLRLVLELAGLSPVRAGVRRGVSIMQSILKGIPPRTRRLVGRRRAGRLCFLLRLPGGVSVVGPRVRVVRRAGGAPRLVRPRLVLAQVAALAGV